MYMSNYFIRGYAIHGYPDVPTYNASHGCLRIPNADAVAVFNQIDIGESIWVYT
jgi:lipoprotein-anchoring transpeptidase ErfK/SrfK